MVQLRGIAESTDSRLGNILEVLQSIDRRSAVTIETLQGMRLEMQEGNVAMLEVLQGIRDDLREISRKLDP